MSHRSTRTTAILGLAAAALLSAAGPAVAAPSISSVYHSPFNPRTTTPTTFGAFADTAPTWEAAALRWDFDGDGMFPSEPADEPVHTFAADGVHRLAVQATTADGATAASRYMLATHPENWAPKVHTHDDDHAVTGRPYAVGASFSDDSPQGGVEVSFDIDGDGTFGDGEPRERGERYWTFGEDGVHEIVARVDDGQGRASTRTFSVRTHTANEAPRLYEGYGDYLTQAGRSVWVSAYGEDDYTDELSYAWKLDGEAVAGTQPYIELRDLAVGEHVATVTVTDEAGLSASQDIRIRVVETLPSTAAALHVEDEDYEVAPTFRTLENARLYASYPVYGGVSYAWDLDADGEFDDATGYATTFAARDQGTYAVAVRISPAEGDPVVVERTVVVDAGREGDPTPPAGGGGDQGSGSGSGASGGQAGTGGGGPVQQSPVQHQVLTPVGTVLRAIGPVALSTGTTGAGVPGTSAPGVDLGDSSLLFGSLLSRTPAEVSATFTARVPAKRAGKGAHASAARKPATKRVSLGRSRVQLAPNTPAQLRLPLGGKARKALKRLKKVKVTAALVVRDAVTGETTKATQRSMLRVVR